MTMERKIGEIFEYNGEWYQCIKDTEYTKCINCCFYNGGHKLCTDEDMGACVKEYRSDAKSICFKNLQKIGEPYEDCGTILQIFKIYTNVTNVDTKGFELHIYSNDTIGIEIEQNKEDMEENYKAEDTPLTRLVGRYVNNLIDYETFEKAVKELYSNKEESKLTLKEFDLEAAKFGKPVCTRDGRKARVICFDRKFYHDGYNYPIVAMVNDNDNELVHAYMQDGLLVGNAECELDLMMLPEKRIGWAKVRKDINLYDTKEEADRKMIGNDEYVTAKVCWEE